MYFIKIWLEMTVKKSEKIPNFIYSTILILALLSAPGVANASVIMPLSAVAPVIDCAALGKVDISDTVGAPVKVSGADVMMTAGKPHCRITGSIAPEIRFEIQLPLAGWTQRYLQTGCGGLCGQLNIRTEKASGCTPVTDGAIVLGATDMGHRGRNLGDGSFGVDPAKRIDFAYRGQHLTALAAKALIKAFYGVGPKFSYFSGCSDGGREALIAAQRYPDDFDGIAAGAPALNFTRQNSFYHAGQALANTGADGRAIITARDLPVLHTGAIAACDAIDGLADGQIDDPRRCKFDPAAVACAPGAVSEGCLSPGQVLAARRLYAGARTAEGKALIAGAPMPGSELSWAGVFVPISADDPIPSAGMALASLRYLIGTPRPEMTLADLGFNESTLAAMEPARQLYNADNPDLSKFVGHGGKLILWHGWSDPHISPINTISYYDEVGKALGESRRSTAVQLFLLPAMFHCFGGDGPSDFDVLTPLMAWTEGAAAPEVIVAKRSSGPPRPMAAPPPAGGRPGEFREGPPPEMLPMPQLAPRSRPIFAYPLVARWSGKGSSDDAANFIAVKPAP